MKRKKLFILIFTLFIFSGFLAVHLFSESLLFPADGCVVDLVVKVYVTCPFGSFGENTDINVTLSYDPEFLTIDTNTGNNGVKASVEETLIEVDTSINGILYLPLNGINCDCLFSYYMKRKLMWMVMELSIALMLV